MLDQDYNRTVGLFIRESVGLRLRNSHAVQSRPFALSPCSLLTYRILHTPHTYRPLTSRYYRVLAINRKNCGISALRAECAERGFTPETKGRRVRLIISNPYIPMYRFMYVYPNPYLAMYFNVCMFRSIFTCTYMATFTPHTCIYIYIYLFIYLMEERAAR